MSGFEKVQAEVLALLGELGIDRAVPGTAFRMEGLVAVDAKQLLRLLLEMRELRARRGPPPLPPPDPTDDLEAYIADRTSSIPAPDPPPVHGPRKR